MELKTNKDDDNLRGERGYGIISVVKKINSTLLSSPNDRRLMQTTVYEAMEGNCIGVSPHKQGHPSIIPNSLHTALATHSSMLQVSGEEEASSSKMKTLTAGLVMGTEWKNKFNIDYCWHRTRAKNPAILNLVKVKNNEDCRIERLTYRNIMDWTDCAKDFLVSIKMVKYEPREIRE